MSRNSDRSLRYAGEEWPSDSAVGWVYASCFDCERGMSSAGIRGDGDLVTMELELQFDTAMFEIYRRAKREAGYNATRYLQMLGEHRGFQTARLLLHAPAVSEGYVALWERGRLDLTVEALVVKPEFNSLFSRQELEIADRRLRDYGYESA